MVKSSTTYVCQNCGYTSAYYLGKCPDCGSWNSLLETVKQAPTTSKAGGSAPITRAVLLSSIDMSPVARITGSGEDLDRVLGGGFVPGSTVLLAGDPGIGKSTLALQAAHCLGKQNHTVLYLTGEEAIAQIRARAERLELGVEHIFAASDTDLETAQNLLTAHSPALAIIDSIQTMSAAYMEQPPGSVSQVKECAMRLSRAARDCGSALMLIGHVTKEGVAAGPRTLEHLVDAVLYLEGDRYHRIRMLRAVKNRYGSTAEVGMLAMEETGLVSVENPSALFLAERRLHVPGSSVAAVLEGSRSFLVEVQALTSHSAMTYPRRTSDGLDPARLALLLAVLERHAGVQTYDSDVYLNVVGGFQLTEPAADLAVCLALGSALRGKSVAGDLAAVGEVGLGGELRGVSGLGERVREAERLGFKRILLPWRDAQQVKKNGISALGVGSIREALEAAWE